MSASSSASCSCCQAWSSGVAQRLRTASLSAAIQSVAVCWCSKYRWRACSRSTSSASRPTRSMSALSTSSTGTTPPSPTTSPSMATPSSSRSSPARQVPCSTPPICQRRAVLLVQAPADAAAGDPAAQPFELVVVEAEPLPYGRAPGEVEHLARRDPRGAELEQVAEHLEQRVGLPQRPVSQPYAEPGGRVRGVVLGAEGERGGDQRRERLDVGAHDEDVAWLERGVCGQEAEDDLPEDLDLSRTAVAGVDLDAAVCRR